MALIYLHYFTFLHGFGYASLVAFLPINLTLLRSFVLWRLHSLVCLLFMLLFLSFLGSGGVWFGPGIFGVLLCCAMRGKEGRAPIDGVTRGDRGHRTRRSRGGLGIL